MKKTIKTALFCVLVITSTFSFAENATKPKPITVGIVVPVAIPAMTQIVDGFKTTLNKKYKGHVTYLIKDAQGNINIQRSIFQELNNSSVHLIAPIGTDAAQMAIAMIRNKPIIGIAADHLKSEANNANNPNVTGVNSHVSLAARVRFIHQTLPTLKKFTLIYSADARIFNQVKQVENAAKKEHIAVQKLMVSQLSDLYTLSKNIATHSQAIFILKDELIVSGLNTLLQQARSKLIPVIASDDGSVSKGAAFALGVSEYQTGVDAAKVAMEILNGKKAGDIPVYMMKRYCVFLNPRAAKSQGIDPNVVKKMAKQSSYKLVILD